MEPKQNKMQDRPPEPIHGLARWIKRYTDHRPVGPFLIHQGLAIALAIILMTLILLMKHFDRHEFTVGLWCCGIFLGLTMLAIIVLSVPWWGGKWCDRWGEKLYAKDGQVKPAAEKRKKATWPMVIAIVILFACIFASIHLEKAGIFPKDYRQPITLIYILPLFIFLGLYQPVEVKIKSPLMTVWPILYVLHAVFVLMNWWPIRLIPRRLDLFVAMWGYGFVTAVVIFIYSRYAMYRLKKAARQGINNSNRKNIPSS